MMSEATTKNRKYIVESTSMRGNTPVHTTNAVWAGNRNKAGIVERKRLYTSLYADSVKILSIERDPHA